MRYITRVTDYERVRDFINSIDAEFSPKISVQEGSIDKYVTKLLGSGNVIVSEYDSLDGLLGYFRKPNELFVDLLWIDPLKRKSFCLYELIMTAYELERDFEGNVTVKTNSKNREMIQVLKHLGFEQTGRFENDFNTERTSEIYNINSNKLKENLDRLKF